VDDHPLCWLWGVAGLAELGSGLRKAAPEGASLRGVPREDPVLVLGWTEGGSTAISLLAGVYVSLSGEPMMVRFKDWPKKASA